MGRARWAVGTTTSAAGRAGEMRLEGHQFGNLELIGDLDKSNFHEWWRQNLVRVGSGGNEQ